MVVTYQLLQNYTDLISNETDCYYIEINDLFEVNCIGTCDEEVGYSNFNESVKMNVWRSFKDCVAFFGTVETSNHSLHIVDEIFQTIFNIRDLAKKIISPFRTRLHTDLMRIECEREGENQSPRAVHVLLSRAGLV